MIEETVFVQALQSKTGKERAFSTLVHQYKEKMYWHIRKMVLDHDDADDVLQNTFIKVFRNIDGFKADSKLYTWMYRIATNEAITFLNNKAKRANTSLENIKNNALSSLESDMYFEGDAMQLILQKAIAKLPERQQLVFNMKYFEEFTYEELSEILETSVGGLKSNYHLAVKKITEYIKTNETI